MKEPTWDSLVKNRISKYKKKKKQRNQHNNNREKQQSRETTDKAENQKTKQTNGVLLKSKENQKYKKKGTSNPSSYKIPPKIKKKQKKDETKQQPITINKHKRKREKQEAETRRKKKKLKNILHTQALAHNQQLKRNGEPTTKIEKRKEEPKQQSVQKKKYKEKIKERQEDKKTIERQRTPKQIRRAKARKRRKERKRIEQLKEKLTYDASVRPNLKSTNHHKKNTNYIDKKLKQYKVKRKKTILGKKMTDQDGYYTRDYDHIPPMAENFDLEVIVNQNRFNRVTQRKYQLSLDYEKKLIEVIALIKEKLTNYRDELFEVATIHFEDQTKPIYDHEYAQYSMKDLSNWNTTALEFGSAGDIADGSVKEEPQMQMEDEGEMEEDEALHDSILSTLEEIQKMQHLKKEMNQTPPDCVVRIQFNATMKIEALKGNFHYVDTLHDVAEWIYTKTGEDSIELVHESKIFQSDEFHDVALKRFDASTTTFDGEALPTVQFLVNRVATTLHEGAIAYDPNPCMMERAKYIPIRLSYSDRKYLRIAESTLSCLDYTSQVDTGTMKPVRRLKQAIQLILGALSSIALSTRYDIGVKLLKENPTEYANHEVYFSRVLELARRYKIMNPEKMRSEYGKLIYMLQDVVMMRHKKVLHVKLIKRVETVFDELERGGIIKEVLEHDKIHAATRDIIQDEQRQLTRSSLDRIKKEKYNSIKVIGRYGAMYSNALDEDAVKQCLYSIADSNTFLNQCARPVTIMIDYLKKYFEVERANFSLAIEQGQRGSRLTHSHDRQYNFVYQSLMLWECIIRDMYRLWFLSEQDLLEENVPYELKNTGQGVHRVQQASNVYRAMLGILNYIKKVVGVEKWVGSSRIHLGDHNVPNCLMFIDKYTQVPRIINPIIQALRFLDSQESRKHHLQHYIQATFGSAEKLKSLILQDFFKHAFDGSGASTFQDAGSCIDGRLTSAWNWCSKLSSKPYYRVFLLSGFTSFDGEFQD